jgi:hypothetical protein
VARKAVDGGGLALWVVGLAVAALAASFLWAHFAPTPRWRHPKPPGIIRVQVLNGSGEGGVGVRVAAFLREGGYHVVEVRNADQGDYFATMVVARRGDLSNAREVAHYLGGPPLILQAWDSDLADVSVLVGRDRSRLRLEP